MPIVLGEIARQKRGAQGRYPRFGALLSLETLGAFWGALPIRRFARLGRCAHLGRLARMGRPRQFWKFCAFCGHLAFAEAFLHQMRLIKCGDLHCRWALMPDFIKFC